jgi:hypothetical protein
MNETVTIQAAYCYWDYAKFRFETVEEASKNDSVYLLPGRVTPKRYVVRYGGGRKAMESGNGNVRKLLHRFWMREPVTWWRYMIGSHERCTRALIRFELKLANQ